MVISNSIEVIFWALWPPRNSSTTCTNVMVMKKHQVVKISIKPHAPHARPKQPASWCPYLHRLKVWKWPQMTFLQVTSYGWRSLGFFVRLIYFVVFLMLDKMQKLGLPKSIEKSGLSLAYPLTCKVKMSLKLWKRYGSCILSMVYEI